MSRFNAPGMTGRPQNNVYTGLAFISMAVTFAALIYVAARFMSLGLLAS